MITSLRGRGIGSIEETLVRQRRRTGGEGGCRSGTVVQMRCRGENKAKWKEGGEQEEKEVEEEECSPLSMSISTFYIALADWRQAPLLLLYLFFFLFFLLPCHHPHLLLRLLLLLLRVRSASSFSCCRLFVYTRLISITPRNVSETDQSSHERNS